MPTPLAPALEPANLERLYLAHRHLCLGVAYHVLRDRAEAEEVVQDVFLSAWCAWHTFDPTRGTPETWLLAMVRHRAIDVLRIRQRRSMLLTDRLDPPDTLDVAREAISNMTAELAQAALADLPPAQQQVIKLAYLAGLTHAEIAEQLAAPLGTVKSRIRLGIHRLRSTLAAQS